MSYYCDSYSQNCVYDCCNAAGSCPSSSYNCHYYYDGTIGYKYTSSTTVSTSFPVGAIIGVVMAVLFIAAAIGFCYWWRKRQAAIALANMSIASNPSINSTVIIPTVPAQPVYPYPQPVNPQPYGAGYAQPYTAHYPVPQPYLQPQSYPIQPQQIYNPSPIGYPQ